MCVGTVRCVVDVAGCGGGAPRKAGRAELGGRGLKVVALPWLPAGLAGDVDGMLPAAGSAS